MDTAVRDRRRAFESLAEGLEGPLFASALRLTRESNSAEDLVQETWVRAYRGFDRFQPGTSFRAWLFTIQMNAFLNRVRRKGKEPELRDFALDEPAERALSAEEDASAEGLERLFDRHVSGEIKRAVDALPEEFRAVLVLTAVAGLSYEETAAAVGAPVGTVMSRLYRARRRLRASLREWARAEGHLKDGPAPARGEGDREVRR
jgi:RNA polymerase sigma-70 factor (ECF subfamily)